MENKCKVTNVLVIGSGGSGLRAAIEIQKTGLDVIVIGKRKKNDAHTVLAAGGINAALGNIDKDDCWEQHFADTYIEGYGIGDIEIIELLAKEAPEIVKEIDSWGASFAKLPNGELDQRFFGAHTYRRTCYAGDFTGKKIQKALLDKVEDLKITILDDQFVTQLLVSEGNCFGAFCINVFNGERTAFLSDSVIIATGGHTRIWKRSSSRKQENTGDGIALALKAGCSVTDMEMVQFHPTGMLSPKEFEGTLVTEAVRGEGGKLLNSKGERFMKKYDEQRMELSTRDRVAIAIYKEIKEGNGTNSGGVFLDISHKSKDFIVDKLPKVYRTFLEAQMLDISKFPMEVAPTAHYSMGGILVRAHDHWTGINGLFAAGEVTGGLHGANRLGGNSLAEILIFGKRAGKAAAKYAKNINCSNRSINEINEANRSINNRIKKGEEIIIQLYESLKDIMWEHCGVIRDKSLLKDGIKKLREIKKRFKNIDINFIEEDPQDIILSYELESSLLSGEATLISALKREESRGAHQRSDYPEINKDLNLNYHLKLDDNQTFQLTKIKVNEPKEELKDVIRKTEKINNFHGKLIE
tara:strand:- start:2354 stop:4099 length:1746 start_codon:yes stop_codon:yes gene_type:complete